MLPSLLVFGEPKSSGEMKGEAGPELEEPVAQNPG